MRTGKKLSRRETNDVLKALNVVGTRIALAERIGVSRSVLGAALLGKSVMPENVHQIVETSRRIVAAEETRAAAALGARPVATEEQIRQARVEIAEAKAEARAAIEEAQTDLPLPSPDVLDDLSVWEKLCPVDLSPAQQRAIRSIVAMAVVEGARR